MILDWGFLNGIINRKISKYHV